MNNEIVYKKNIVPFSRDELLKLVKNALNESRFKHVLRVEQTAIELATKYGVDLEKASVAALVHDYAKNRPDQDFINAVEEYRIDPEILNYGNPIWHGVIGWIFAKNELHVDDIEVLNSVKYHTVGHQYMTMLEQIIYMADYIEPGRDFPGVKKAREITNESLTQGVKYQTKQTLMYLIENSKSVYPQALITYNSWVPSL